MKKNYILTLFLIGSTMMFGQTFINQNGNGDGLWSTATNWNPNGVPASTADVILNASPVLNADYTVHKLADGYSAQAATVSGTGTLTIDINSGTAATGIANSTGAVEYGDLTFTSNVTIGNILTGPTKISNANGDDNNIYFTSTSTLNLSSKLQTAKVGTAANGSINFDGNLTGGSDAISMIIGSDNVVFGSTSDHSSFGGDFVFYKNAKAVVNTTDNGTFLPNGRKVQINGTGATIELNGANVYKGNLVLGSTHDFTLDINANQDEMRGIVLNTGNVLTLDIDNSVASVSFINNNTYNWNTGTISIVGFEPGVLRFGEDNTGLTVEQMAAISGDGVASGNALALDANGYLVLASSLSIEKYNHEIYSRLSYPSTTEGVLNFKVPVEDYIIYNLLGEKVQVEKVGTERQSIDVSNLQQGMYILSIEGKRVERFIKK